MSKITANHANNARSIRIEYDLVCDICKNKFKSRYQTARCCSEKCRRRARNAKVCVCGQYAWVKSYYGFCSVICIKEHRPELLVCVICEGPLREPFPQTCSKRCATLFHARRVTVSRWFSEFKQETRDHGKRRRRMWVLKGRARNMADIHEDDDE